MAIEFVVGIAVVALLVGAGIGFFASGGAGKRGRVTELEAALASAQTELADYKREVFGQFAETAEKFRALDKSYNDLHRQLATSSVALCGDAATPLLAAPADEPQMVLDAETQADAEVNTDAEPQIDAEPQADANLQADTKADADTQENDTRLQAEAAEENLAQAVNEVASADDNIVVPEAQEVPTLTDLDSKEDPQDKRASA